MTMSPRKCQACNELFRPDPRNGERQRFCSNVSCRQERRRREQRLRRATLLERICAELLSKRPKVGRGLQKASPIPEALMDTQSPVLIGLISMLIDSVDREEIHQAIRRLWQRGFEILNPPHSKPDPTHSRTGTSSNGTAQDTASTDS